jgi:hypothetical protein
VLLKSILAFVVLAGVTVLGVTAPASGVTLCKVDKELCPMGDRYGSGTSVTGTLKANTSSVFTTDNGDVTCASSSLGLKTTAESGAPLKGTASTWSFAGGKCIQSVFNATCTRQETLDLPYAAAIEATTGGEGLIKLSSAGSGSPQVWFECGGALMCRLEKTEIVLSVVGGPVMAGAPPAIAKASSQLFKGIAGSFCPKVGASWTSEYELLPSPLFISKEP